MSVYRLAVDIGASGGRVMAGRYENGQLELQELHRFDNKMTIKNGCYCWNVERLFDEVKTGITLAKTKGIKPASIGINTWAVDFVLLDEQDELLTEAVSYRDSRTDGIMEEVLREKGAENLYARTGIQFQPFNTVYQLLALKKTNPEVLSKAKTFLMLPDYFHFLLTGEKRNEYTNATTTQLVNAFDKEWDIELIEELGLPPRIFQPLAEPKTVLGTFKPEIEAELGIRMDVILPATHDTASAVAAVPDRDSSLYISSGTWSLIGVENDVPICSTSARENNFTNEGGIDDRFRFLKNIMGLWMIQEVKRLYEDEYSFAELVERSKEATDFKAVIDVDQRRFLKPVNMIEEIQSACMEAGEPVPATPGEVAKCIYDSLIASYKRAIKQIEETLEREYPAVLIIGGGSQNEQLNQLLADRTGKDVFAGPTEATALGNLIAQQIAGGEIATLEKARTLIKKSFNVKHYQPTRRKINDVYEV
ncbi:rhamnulokinase [Shouchella shacheensis]|uniref:rhamnulokinase n=1 Tax=Shouchella shacheensis TaxID=1649580 RepID=UPI0007401315|nr:rhamnulokinase [Shouchella shacheensis]